MKPLYSVHLSAPHWDWLLAGLKVRILHRFSWLYNSAWVCISNHTVNFVSKGNTLSWQFEKQKTSILTWSTYLDGSFLLHTVMGDLLCSLVEPSACGHPIAVTISNEGFILANYADKRGVLALFSVNGTHYRSESLEEQVLVGFTFQYGWKAGFLFWKVDYRLCLLKNVRSKHGKYYNKYFNHEVNILTSWRPREYSVRFPSL